MEIHDSVLIKHISEQVALEEHLCALIDKQISEIDHELFPDAIDLLVSAQKVLLNNFAALNKLLDQLEVDASISRSIAREGNGHITVDREGVEYRQTSKMLRDDYSALNLITISNTLLHTIALALGSADVASTALRHLENLAPLVVKIGELMPEIATKELGAQFSWVDLLSAKTALKNVQLAWQKAS
jgi:hypothetical protein